jgi:hypothetical protein
MQPILKGHARNLSVMIPRLLLSLVATGALGLASHVASAADPPAQPKSLDGVAPSPYRVHPDAQKINQGNRGVVHSGPGMPLVGTRHSPADPAKDKKK